MIEHLRDMHDRASLFGDPQRQVVILRAVEPVRESRRRGGPGPRAAPTDGRCTSGRAAAPATNRVCGTHRRGRRPRRPCPRPSRGSRRSGSAAMAVSHAAERARRQQIVVINEDQELAAWRPATPSLEAATMPAVGRPLDDAGSGGRGPRPRRSTPAPARTARRRRRGSVPSLRRSAIGPIRSSPGARPAAARRPG